MKQVHKIVLVLVIILATPLVIDIAAQCPMCRMAAESNLDNGGTQGRGLNTGILYLFAMPYLIAGVIGLVWWKNRIKDADLSESENDLA